MKKTIIVALFLICVYGKSHGQDTSVLRNKKPLRDIKNYGPYTVITDNGKITVQKNANYTGSVISKRGMSSGLNTNITTEIYTSNSSSPILKKYFIYDINSLSSERLMSKDERQSKYKTTAGVLVVHLKPGISLLNYSQLLSKFKIPTESSNLKLFADYKPIETPNELLAVADAVLKIDIVTDTDGTRFLNIVTKQWAAHNGKAANGNTIWIR